MTTTTRIALGLLAAVPLLLPAPASRAVDQSSWGKRVAESERLLQQGDYAAAHRVTAVLVDEMGNTLMPGEGSEEALGSVLALHALAEAGTGRREEALWHWGVAQSLKPSLRTLDLGVYGDAGAALDDHRFSAAGKGKCKLNEYAGKKVQPTSIDGLTPPVKVKAPPPVYSTEARNAGVEGVVIVQAVIDAQGRPRAPYVLKTDSPNLAWLATEAIRDWRFEPARYRGVPIPVCYNLTVNFNLGR